MVMVAAFVLIAVFVMMVMMVMLVLLFVFVIVEIQVEEAQVAAVAAFQRVQDCRLLQLGPGRRDHGRVRVQSAQEGRSRLKLFVVHFLGAGKDQRRSAFHLVLEEFTEVLQIDLRFLHVNDGDAFGHGKVRNDVSHAFDGGDDVGQLAHARRLDDDPFGSIGLDHLMQGFGEIAHQRAADAARVHFGDLNAGVLQEAAVDADLAVFVLNQDDLLAGIDFFDQLADKCCFSGAEKAGNNGDFGHVASGARPGRAIFISVSGRRC